MGGTEIICLGISALDILVRGISDFRLDGQTVFSRDIELIPGGDALNEAVTLSRLGHKVRLLTLTGADFQRDVILKYCSENGLAADGIQCGSFPTSTSIAMITENGERTIIGQENGSAREFSASDIDMSVFQPGVKAVSIGSLFCSERLDDKGLTAILEKAHNCGAVTVADFVMDLKEWSLDSIAGALKYLDYAIPSYEEAVYYTKMQEPSRISAVFKSYGVKNVIIKMGADGIYADIEGRELQLPSLAKKVIDTTGAGDSFTAGFISGLVQNLNAKEGLIFASAAAAITVQQVGASGAVNSREQIRQYMEEEVWDETI